MRLTRDLLITSGSQQALTLVATVLLEPGDRVLVEEPSYLAALQCFQLAGAQAVPVPCDEDGLDPEALAELVIEHRPKLLYTIPTFHNPTGRTLPLERRRQIAAVAERTGLWIVEDDPYGELRYHGEPLAAIASLPEAQDRTLALSTLSKIAAPGLRLGWVRAPAPLRRPLTIAKQAADLHSSTVDQAAAARWLNTVDLDAHIAGLRRPTVRAGIRSCPGSQRRCPPGQATTIRTEGCSCGRGCPTAGTRRSCWRGRWSTTLPTFRGRRSSPARRTRRACVCRSRRTRLRRSGGGLERLREAWLTT